MNIKLLLIVSLLTIASSFEAFGMKRKRDDTGNINEAKKQKAKKRYLKDYENSPEGLQNLLTDCGHLDKKSTNNKLLSTVTLNINNFSDFNIYLTKDGKKTCIESRKQKKFRYNLLRCDGDSSIGGIISPIWLNTKKNQEFATFLIGVLNKSESNNIPLFREKRTVRVIGAAKDEENKEEYRYSKQFFCFKPRQTSVLKMKITNDELIIRQ